jgi:peptidoglycan/LPS O-acetylase OafA/YrhL
MVHPLGDIVVGIEGFWYGTLGMVGVTLFLFISGLSLTLAYKDKGYLAFIKARIFRIYPTYYLCLILAIVASAWLAGSSTIQETFTSPLRILGILTGLSAYWGDWGGLIMSTSWFIGLIIALYLLFPLLHKTFTQKPLLTLAGLFIIEVANRLLIGHMDTPLANRPLDWFVLCRIFEFGLGIYVGLKVRLPNWKSPKWVKWASELSFPLFLIHYPLLQVFNEFKGLAGLAIFSLVSVTTSWLVLLVTQHQFKSERLLGHG